MLGDDFKPQGLGKYFTIKDDNKYLLLHPDKPVWTIINSIGYKTFSFFNGYYSVKEIAQQLSQQYCQSFEPVFSDVQNFVLQLTQKGFLMPSYVTQDKKWEQEQGVTFEGTDHVLKKIHLNITENCNLSCKHCGITDGEKKQETLTTDQILRIVDEAQEIRAGLLAITGGEPLLRKDGLQILSYAAKRVKTVLTSNATLINDDLAKHLADLNITLQISLDGPKGSIHDFIRGQGSFAKTMKAIDLLLRQGAGNDIALCITVNKINLKFIPAILELAFQKGISSIRFITLQKMGMARIYWSQLVPSTQDYNNFYNYLYREVPLRFPTLKISPGFQGFVVHHHGQSKWCQIENMIAISAEGDLYPCSLLMEPSFKLGNIKEMSLQKALRSSKMEAIGKICRARKDEIARCQGCTWKHFCQASCPGSIYQEKGNFYEVDDLCEIRHKLYPQVIFDSVIKKFSSAGAVPPLLSSRPKVRDLHESRDGMTGIGRGNE